MRHVSLHGSIPPAMILCYSAGALVIADFRTLTVAKEIEKHGEVVEVTDVRDRLKASDEFYGTFLYVSFLHRQAADQCAY